MDDRAVWDRLFKTQARTGGAPKHVKLLHCSRLDFERVHIHLIYIVCVGPTFPMFGVLWDYEFMFTSAEICVVDPEWSSLPEDGESARLDFKLGLVIKML